VPRRAVASTPISSFNWQEFLPLSGLRPGKHGPQPLLLRRHAIYGDDVVVGVFLFDLVRRLIVLRVEPVFHGIQAFESQDNYSVMGRLARYDGAISSGDIDSAMSEDRSPALRQYSFAYPSASVT
jgi:hypothetical protein